MAISFVPKATSISHREHGGSVVVFENPSNWTLYNKLWMKDWLRDYITTDLSGVTFRNRSILFNNSEHAMLCYLKCC